MWYGLFELLEFFFYSSRTRKLYWIPFFGPMKNIFSISFSNLKCLIFMHTVNVRTIKAADVSLIPPNNSKAVVGRKEFLKTIHTDTMQGLNMNTIWDTHLGMYDIQSHPSPLFLCCKELLHLRDWHSIFCVCKGRTRTKRKHYPRGKRVACGFGRALNLKESFISVQCCRGCMSMRSTMITLPNKTCCSRVLGQQTHSRCSSVLQISHRQTVVL